MPVGEETGEREGRDVHVLPIDRRVPPFLTLLIHFPAFGAAGGTEVEGIGTQEKLLDEFLRERAAIGTEHAHVQPVCLYVVEHVRQLLHLLELNIRVPLPVLHAYHQRAGGHHFLYFHAFTAMLCL